MAIKLIANYSKRLGLPGYSSHQFSVSVETEIVATDDVQGECGRLYQLLQSNVDGQIRETGFVPPSTYGMGEDPVAGAGANGKGDRDNGNNSRNRGPLDGSRWKCSDKQRDLILKLVEEHDLDKHEVEALSVERFGHGVRLLDKMEASGLIDELLDKHAPNNRNGRRTRPNAYAGNGGGKGGRR